MSDLAQQPRHWHFDQERHTHMDLTHQVQHVEGDGTPLLGERSQDTDEREPSPDSTVCDDLRLSFAGHEIVVDVCEQCLTLNAGKLFYEDIRSWDLEYLESHTCGLTVPLRAVAKRPPYSVTGCLRFIAYDYTCKAKDSASDTRTGIIMHFRKASLEGVGMIRTARTFNLTSGIDEPTRALEQVHFHQVRLWLEFCRKNHTACSLRSSPAVPGLKLIDCNSRKVCLAPPNQPYLALSYVWGSQSDKTSVYTHDKDARFPKTVEDAIKAAKEIGVPYLWVDRYCIDDKNVDEKHRMIVNMDKIYSGAEMTIVAGSGTSPDHGLPGVSRPRQTAWRRNFDSGILDYFESPTIEVKPNLMDSGLWSNRGWTFQEMLLSRRRLVFLDSQMFFQCCSQIFCDMCSLGPIDRALREEDNSSISPSVKELGCPADSIGLNPRTASLLPNITGRDSFEIYILIDEYSWRKLSYFEDRLNAMEGIFAAFRDSVEGFVKHFWGIPILDNENARRIDTTLSFYKGLQWTSSDPFPSLGMWPSWTWASRDSAVQYDWSSPASLHKGVSVKLRRRDGHEEDPAQFAYGPRSYIEYHPWVELSTWVGPCLDLDAGSVETFGDRVPRNGDIALYIGMRYDNQESVENLIFLIASQLDDGSFRRFGLAKHQRASNLGWLHDDEKETQWEDGVREQPLSTEEFFEGWEHKTIRLV